MSTRREFRAMTREAVLLAVPVAAFMPLLGGLLLLIAP